MMHPHTELRFINPEKGFGVVATKRIPKGTITWIFDELDKVFSPEVFSNMDQLFKPVLEKYCYRDPQGNYVLCWDIARYVNHSFVSNCLTTPYNFELAIRDIEPGEELTDDYGYLNVSEPIFFPKEEGSTRESVNPDDTLKFYPEWDRLIEEAFLNFGSVEQPLGKLIDPQFQDKVEKISKREIRPDSVLNCYFQGS